MPSPIEGAALDHVAVAVERWSDAWPRYAVALGGAWHSGGLNVGFGPAQLGYANGGRVEVLQPWRPEDNPFLRRFLDRHGPGPHHMTFKVPDLAGALDTARSRGWEPVGVDLENPQWKEAFLHPRQATGIVVQLAQSNHDWATAPAEGFPLKRNAAAAFVRITHAVADLAGSLTLFEGLLGATVLAEGAGPEGSWRYVDLAWARAPQLRLVAPAEGAPVLDDWLGRRPGRLHHLAFAMPAAVDGSWPEEGGGSSANPSPAPSAGVLPADWATAVVEPQDNLGTRLVLLREEARGPRGLG